MLRALLHRRVARVGKHVVQAGFLAQATPEMRGVGREVKVAFARRMDAGDAARTHVAPDLARLTLGPHQARRLHRQRAAQQGNADVLADAAAFALVERRGDPGREQGRGVVIDDRAVKDFRRAARFALLHAHPAARLQNLVVAGVAGQRPMLAVARHRAVDQARMARLQVGVGDAQALGHAGTEVMHQHVGGGQAALQRGAPLGALEVEHQAVLAAIHPQKRAALGGQRRRVLAQVVAVRRLDLEHLSALVGEQRAAVRSGDVGAQVEHAHTAQGPRRPRARRQAVKRRSAGDAGGRTHAFTSAASKPRRRACATTAWARCR